MKHARLSLIAALLVGAVTTDAQAQLFARPTVGIFGGLASPRGTLDDEAGSGWNAGALFKMRAYRALDIRVDGTYAKFGAVDFDIPLVSGDTAVGHLDPKIPFATLDAHINLGPDSAEYPGDNTVTPHFLVGVGVYKLDYNFTCTGPCVDEIRIIPTENHFGLNVGGGATIPLLGIRSFVEARYHRISQKPEFGDARTFITISAGLRIR